jgi:hypothetical protein
MISDSEPGPVCKPADPVRSTVAVPGHPSKEVGGRPGPEPTRYGDWERNGRCIDF